MPDDENSGIVQICKLQSSFCTDYFTESMDG